MSETLGPEAGEHGVPVEAICVGCQQVRTKRYQNAGQDRSDSVSRLNTSVTAVRLRRIGTSARSSWRDHGEPPESRLPRDRRILVVHRQRSHPYWALTQPSIQDLDGYAEIQREFGGEEWQIRFSYNSETGLAPRPSDPIGGDTVYEWKIHVENVFTEAKADYVVSPRWDGLKKPNGDQAQIPWCGGEGCQIHLQGSNLSFDEYQWLLQRSLQELADHAGTDFSTRYFNQIRGDSNINTLERYVRVKREYAKKLTRSTGAFYSVVHLLADVQVGD